MKKIIATLALASFGAVAFAQDAAPEKDFVIGAKFDFEGRYVSGGKRHANENTQTTISFLYFAPQTSDIGLTPYAELFWMSPTDNKRYDTELSNEGSLTIGSKVDFGEDFGIDFGYKYTGWNDRASSAAMNRAYVNRTNELYVGVYSDISLIHGNDDATLQGTAYVRYNWNLEQLSYEIGLAKSFAFDEVGLHLAAVYGYVDSNKANGDQRVSYVKDGHNDYGYIALSADLSYRINSGTDIGVGVRYAYNNDSDHDDAVGGFNGDNNSSNVWWGAWINFRY